MKGISFCFGNRENFIKNYKEVLSYGKPSYRYLGAKTSYFLADRLADTCGKEPVSYSAYLAMEDFKDKVLSNAPVSTRTLYSMTELDCIDDISDALEKIGIPCAKKN